ncbi:MAG: hypothetical protein HY689_00265 [Chloroflexi bacterium]|nr:hypothetical protein [Chloroflexota bacterium]
MLTYTRLSGEVLDLSHLTDEERAHFERADAAYRVGMAWAAFGNEFVYGPANPLLRTTPEHMVTSEVYVHPLFQALHDLDDRLAISQHAMLPDDGDRVDSDPLADEWIPVAEAEARKGVTHNALHHAIRQGRVIAQPAKPGGSWLLVSVRSLEHWQPSPARQAAGRAGRKRASA